MIRSALTLAALCACSSSNGTPAPTSSHADQSKAAPSSTAPSTSATTSHPAEQTPPPPATDTPSTAKATSCDPSQIAQCFGDVKTVAGSGKIRRKGENGWKTEFEGKLATEAELSRPHFAMADEAGNIFVADKDAHAIRKIAVDGTITTVAGTGRRGDDGDGSSVAASSRLSSPNGLWVGKGGVLYVLDLGNNKVRRIADGKMTTLFSVRQGISLGRGLWIADDESSGYVASGRRIFQWRAKGNRVAVFAKGFRGLANIVVAPNGKLVATDRTAGRVYEIDADGNRRVIAGNGNNDSGGAGKSALESSLPGVRAVWFANGGMFLGTHESSRIWFVGPNGALQRLLEDDGISEVRGLSVGPKGELIVVDDDHGFVRVLPFVHR